MQTHKPPPKQERVGEKDNRRLPDNDLPWPGGGIPPSEREKHTISADTVQFHKQHRHINYSKESSHSYIIKLMDQLCCISPGECIIVSGIHSDHNLNTLRYHLKHSFGKLFTVLRINDTSFKVFFKGDKMYENDKNEQ